MKQYLVAGLAGMVVAGGLISAAPPASAGCQYTGMDIISKCDGPVQPDGTWQRCVIFRPTYLKTPGSGHNYAVPNSVGDKRCDVMGPDLHPWGLAFSDPPTHIDD